MHRARGSSRQLGASLDEHAPATIRERRFSVAGGIPTLYVRMNPSILGPGDQPPSGGTPIECVARSLSVAQLVLGILSTTVASAAEVTGSFTALPAGSTIDLTTAGTEQ